MKIHLKSAIYLFFLVAFSSATAGSYEDFFKAISRDDVRTISNLLQRGFDPNTTDPRGRNALVMALQENSLKVVDSLIRHEDTRVNVLSQHDESPLMLAALRGLTEVCEKLIERGASINKPGWTPLHYAATGGHLEVVRLLVSKNAHVNATSPNQSTPLMMAALYGSSETVKLLLQAGADSSLKNNLGLTALEFASLGGRVESEKLIAESINADRLSSSSRSSK